jgi:polypeptide N-acetylgalactosaminyltransferase
MKRNILKLIKLLLLSSFAALIVILFTKSLSNTTIAKSLFPQSGKQYQKPFFGGFFARPRNVDKKRIDWHNYKLISEDQSRNGFGEQGKKEALDDSEKAEKDKLFSQNGFNALLSDKISLNRSVPDIRHPRCRDKKYLSELPSVSVVIPFYNEHFSTLLRTVYSVLNRSPSELLTEIILVDDCSKKG